MTLQKEVSLIQEKAVAKCLEGKLTPASGGTAYDGGDVDANTFLVECKTVTKEQTSFSVKKEWLTKIREQAYEQRKENFALAFRFAPTGDDFVVLDIETFKLLKDAYESSL